MLRRAADEAVGRLRRCAQRPHAAGEVVAAAATQPLQRVALAALLIGEQLGLGGIGLEIVQRGDGLRAVAERRMAGHVVDALRADIDHPTVAHAVQFLPPGRQHRLSSRQS